MIHDLFVPIMGTTIVKLEVIEWSKSVGERIKRGDTVLVVKADKADIDVESFNEGYLAAILIQAGETVALGEVATLIAETKEEMPIAQEEARRQAKKNFLEIKTDGWKKILEKSPREN